MFIVIYSVPKRSATLIIFYPQRTVGRDNSYLYPVLATGRHIRSIINITFMVWKSIFL